MSKPANVFDDPQAVARYAEGPPRLVPGFADLQRMTRLLIAERAPQDARVLVVGAGGGLELKVFAENHPGWNFDGVDPSAEMLKLAEATLGPLVSRVRLHAERDLWLSRYVSFAISSGVDPASVANARTAIAAQLPILAPEQDEASLREAGFTDVTLFYAGFTFRGWVGYA